MYTLFKEILFIFQTYKTIFYFIHIFYYKLSLSGFIHVNTIYCAFVNIKNYMLYVVI